jgi:hypothetical protein
MVMVVAGEFFRLMSPIVSIVSSAVILCLETGPAFCLRYPDKPLNPL